MINLIRIDERLVHGQVAFAWSVAYPSDAILVMDPGAAGDSLQKQLLKLACPKSMKCFVTDAEGGLHMLKKYGSKRFLVVAKHPKYALYLLENGIQFDSLNVGGLYFKEDRKQITKTVYVDEETDDILRRIHGYGVYLDGRTTPRDNSLDLFTLL